MVNKTMNHLIIGENNYEIEDKQARDDISLVSDDVDEVKEQVEQMNLDLLKKVDGGYVRDGVGYFTSGDDVLFEITGIGGGGGGMVGSGRSGSRSILPELP